MKDDNIIDFPLVRTPNHATDAQINDYWVFAEALMRAQAGALTPELFFSTKKRHELGRTKCRKCACNFLPDTACPNCGSKELEPFVGVEPIAHSDREATLNAIDPEWKERFKGDSGAALDYYRKFL